MSQPDVMHSTINWRLLTGLPIQGSTVQCYSKDLLADATYLDLQVRLRKCRMSRDVHTADLATEVVLVFLRQLGDLLKVPRILRDQGALLEGLELVLQAVFLAEDGHFVEDILFWNPGQWVADSSQSCQ